MVDQVVKLENLLNSSPVDYPADVRTAPEKKIFDRPLLDAINATYKTATKVHANTGRSKLLSIAKFIVERNSLCNKVFVKARYDWF